ncbi:SusC/RagA family TonB-linked outer membrane protein [Chitinophaga sp. S165]|uniref:SusC/RagA family TonB-linked outer membrane protein n=1 Tax=Chitinophaga sp. S165 TaxID=2135462 RepID=UPI000D709C15|nr:SusC/RagA family TonB-linked outer membrane protein [Chitinophaga sp. S165]PWV44531.1 TonB-linked SusC/RagA family outer membrane protein [Chitinophaga sp. S165]
MCISTPRSNLVVRFLSVFLFCFTSLYASTDQTGKQKVTVVGSDVALASVFKQIEKQTGLRFMYAVDAVDVQEKVTISFDRVMLDDVLESLLGKRGIEWIYREGVISLKHVQRKTEASGFITSPPMSVSGRVLDANGNPVPGATIIVHGGKKGTKTDMDGKFALDGVESGAILSIRSIGFKTKDVQVTERVVVVRMDEVISTLSETVIKGGYYNTTSGLSTGNAITIDAKDIEKAPVTDPLLALQGRVTGMSIIQTTGIQGGEVKVQIRGRNSLTNGTQPLFIVDGIPYNSSFTGSFGAVGRTLSTLNFVNPADIESISVLKDADATAIYGSRGANGVVLITTKKGRSGTTKIDINVYKGWAKVANRLEQLNTPQYLKMRRNAFINDGVTPTIQNAPDLLQWDTTRYTDWQKELIGGTANYSDVRGSISGGSPTVKYLIGGNYHKEGTIFPIDFGSDNAGVHFNIKGNSLNEKFETSLTGSYLVSNTDFPGGNYVGDINLPPNAPPIYNSDGSLNWANSSWTNPYASMNNGLYEARTSNLIGSVDFSYKIMPDLRIKANFGVNELMNNVFIGTKIAGYDPQVQRYAQATGIYTTAKNRSWIFEPQVDYQKVFGFGTLNLLGGATLLGNRYDQQTLSLAGITDDGLIRNPASAPFVSAGGTGYKYKYIALFGRLGYNFDDKYLVNLTIRRDGSSRFGPRRQYAVFGALGMGWVFSQEHFMQSLLPVLSYGKIRLSYGTTGNDQIGDYRYLDRYMFQELLYQGIKGLEVVGIYNPDFGWELTKKREIGIELGFLKDRLLFNNSYYLNTSSNQLIEYAQPSMIGASSMLGNLAARIENKGWESIITSKNIQNKNFEWSTSFNVSISKNKVATYTDRAVLPIEVGKSLLTKYLYKFINVDPSSGQYMFANTDGKPSLYNAASSTAINLDLAPKWFGGFQNTFRYKNVSVDIFLQYSVGKGYSGMFNSAWSPGTRRNQPSVVMEAWKNIGDVSEYQQFSQNTRLRNSYVAWINSDQAYVDASFIRCKNVSVSWQFTQKWLQRFKMNSGRIYFQGQNLFTLTKYPGWDPETQVVTNIPPLRILTLGVQMVL